MSFKKEGQIKGERGEGKKKARGEGGREERKREASINMEEKKEEWILEPFRPRFQ